MGIRAASKRFILLFVCVLFVGLVAASASFAAQQTYDETSTAITYSPSAPPWSADANAGWRQWTASPLGDHNGAYAYSNRSAAFNPPAATATFSFTGNRLEWRTVKAASCGTASVSIDGGPATLVSLYSGSTVRQSLAYTWTGTSGPHTFEIVNASVVTAPTRYNVGIDYFVVDEPSNIVASSGANGSVSPSGSTSVAYGADQTYAIVPAGGFRVQNVLVDGASVGAVTSYPFTGVTAGHTISATFEPIPAPVSTPASSPWMLLIAALACLGLAAVWVRTSQSQAVVRK